MINIGLIGAGGVGRIHLNNALQLRNGRLVAVADISKKHRSFAKAKGVEVVYGNYQDLLENPAIDCVIIALPTFLHSECAILAAENGKHVFIEKPLARNVKEGTEIVSKTRKAGVEIMVGYPLRFSKFAKIKKEIDIGHLGDIITAIATNMSSGPFFQRISNGIPSPVPSWWFERKLVGGGALIDLGSHMINLLRYYFEDEIVGVKSFLDHRFNMPFEDHAVCFIEFKKGVSAIVNVGWHLPYHLIGVELYGTAEHMSEISRPPTMIDYAKSIVTRQSLENPPEFSKELQYFIECLKSGRSPSPSAEEALKDLEVVSTAYKNVIKLDS